MLDVLRVVSSMSARYKYLYGHVQVWVFVQVDIICKHIQDTGLISRVGVRFLTNNKCLIIFYETNVQNIDTMYNTNV